ncbi:unnamed protein product [Adineta steineri]|uniref:Uncharacterized protein n=1 Tax=Adineta steineri TaxID=433720 RepID=A0A814BRS5_9BILA|nr:unnamed protein product [Adineta steineri]CAF1089075.1 unnamed protein product [Adineta steineri]CAF4407069.1 unnamed protein product [Adineta steineri]
MAQSQGYKRFRSSINTVYNGTSTPQTPTNKIFPRSSTPNPHFKEPIIEQTIPVPISSPRPNMTVHNKIHKKQRQHRRSHHRYQIHIDHIILIQQQRKSCSHCHCKKTKSQQILGVF